MAAKYRAPSAGAASKIRCKIEQGQGTRSGPADTQELVAAEERRVPRAAGPSVLGARPGATRAGAGGEEREGRPGGPPGVPDASPTAEGRRRSGGE